MTHTMRLYSEPFEQIRSGNKTIELRLNDEKRQQISVGDTIEFRETDHADKRIVTRVVALHPFPTFRQLYETLPLLQCGYTAADIAGARPEDMDAYYSPEEQERYGVLGIAIEVIGNCQF